ncbi:ABC transporter substrate-binding protein [Pelomonas sp. KK5]|uniref:ABC transporter substrate-binding protein n=1 Tax=Pelomonas sp. KK5 TaxID=1855730 RepID=UPI00097BE4BC|nr:ABC transporter substrate-binding protein [Pelomonas sp. KK5]
MKLSAAALCLSVLSCGSIATAADAPQSMTLHLSKAEDAKTNQLLQYRIDLLTAALGAVGVKATVEGCKDVDARSADRRISMAVIQGEGCDVIATSAGGENTAGLTPVPVPIYLGGGGIRALLMTPNSLKKTHPPLELAGLQKLSVGSGTTWADTPIMEANGIHVEKSPVYQQLFVMLRKERFDALNRGIFEVGPELAGIAAGGIVLEPSAVIQYGQYGTDLFFYVSPKNTQLRDLLARGMKQLYCSGQLHQMLKSHPSNRDMWALVKPDQRSVITLKVPDVITKEEKKALSEYGTGWKAAGPSRQVCADGA